MLLNRCSWDHLILFLCLLALMGCRQNQEIIERGEDVKNLPPVISVVRDLDEDSKEYTIEGTSRTGDVYTGQVTLKGDIGAGYITKDSLTPQFYIEVRRVQEGGLIGTDTNGVEYKLSFKNESNH